MKFNFDKFWILRIFGSILLLVSLIIFSFVSSPSESLQTIGMFSLFIGFTLLSLSLTTIKTSSKKMDQYIHKTSKINFILWIALILISLLSYIYIDSKFSIVGIVIVFAITVWYVLDWIRMIIQFSKQNLYKA